MPQATVDLIIGLRCDLASKGLDHGPHTIAWHLKHHHALVVSAPSIHRHLSAAGLITPTPQRRPKSSYIRFAAEQPNERWQADFTHWWLADTTHVEILNWLDDHAPYALSVTAHPRITGPILRAEFRKACANHGIPYSTLTDNGMVFTTRFSGGKGGRNHLESELHLTDLYNHRRPHRELPHRTTPATAYTTRPKATPGQRLDTHNRVRTDRIDQYGKLTLRHAGRLHHIGIGRTHARTRESSTPPPANYSAS